MDKQSAQKAVAGALTNWLNGASSFLKLGGSVMFAAALAAFAWAWSHRTIVEVLPLQGTDSELASVNFARALEDVSLGARSEIDVDPSVLLTRASSPPPIAIPGLSFNFAQIVGFVQFGDLAPTRVHGAYSGSSNAHQLSLQVQGPAIGSASLRTMSYDDPRDAFLDAAQQTWRILDPVVLASYLYRRDRNESLKVVREILVNPSSSPSAKAGAYRIWGLILRDELDYEGARARLREAIDFTSDEKSHARAWLDYGHTYLWENRWRTAQEVYREAIRLDPDWAAPHQFMAQALAGQGDLPGAISEYEAAIELDALYVDAWIGLGEVYTRQERYFEAISALTEARQRNAKRGSAEDTEDAKRTHDRLGQALLKAKCPAAAANHFSRAVGIDESYESSRPDIACQEKVEPKGEAPDLVEAAASHSETADCIAMTVAADSELTAIAFQRSR